MDVGIDTEGWVACGLVGRRKSVPYFRFLHNIRASRIVFLRVMNHRPDRRCGGTAGAFGCGQRLGRDLRATKTQHLAFRPPETTSCDNHTDRVGIPCFHSCYLCHWWFRDSLAAARGRAGVSAPRCINKPNPSQRTGGGLLRTNKANLATWPIMRNKANLPNLRGFTTEARSSQR